MTSSATEIINAMAAAWNAGDAGRVLALATQASDVAMDNEGFLALLGVAQQAMHRHAEAANTFARLTRMRPEVSAYWNNLGVVCRQTGDLAAAEQALSTAHALAPRDAEVLYNLGLLRVQQQHWLQAREALLDAVQRAPQFVAARLEAAHVCHLCGDNSGEEAMLEGAEQWPPQPAAQALILSAMLSTQGKPEAALRTLAHAYVPEGSEAEPIRLCIIAQRTMLYERNNRLEAAQRELEQLPLTTLDALPADAADARIDVLRAHAAMDARTGRHVEAAELWRRVLALATDSERRANAGFGLAAAYDRQGCHADAWQTVQGAHAAQLDFAREIVPELLAPDSQPLAMAEQSVGRDAYARWKPLTSADARHSPVLVIGFPRSGTTLLEQMLDAHPDFRSMDERAFIHELVERMEGVGQRYPSDLANLTQTDVDQLRAVYWRLVDRVLPDRGQRRLVDKNPLNMLCLPMILRLFPEARIILCLRHPCDVVLSCYMQSFRSPAFMVLCSSLPRLARGYTEAFEQCCRHIEVLKPRVLEWRYESVVDDFDGAVARLGQFLEVADASPFADFAAHARDKRFIATPSYAQVTQPVNANAVGRWVHYREQFEHVLPMLRPWLDRFGYAI